MTSIHTESAHVEFIWSFFKGIVLSAISLFTPLAKVKTNSLPKWFNLTICHCLHIVHSLRKRYKHNQSSSNLLRLSSAVCLLQLNILDTCSSFESNLVSNFASNKDYEIYRYICDLSGKAHIPSVMFHDSYVRYYYQLWMPISASNDSNKSPTMLYNVASTVGRRLSECHLSEHVD